MSRYQSIGLSQDFFRQVREYALDFQRDRVKVKWAIDQAVMGYAIANLSFAQKMSRGFLDPLGKNSAMAWKIPVRRIKQNYFAGWKVRRVALAYWECFNDSREAYYIEFGINHSGTGLVSSNGSRVRIRRPILKLSIGEALSFAQASDMGWKDFIRNFQHHSFSSPLTNLSEAAVNQSLNANEGFVYGMTMNPI